MRKQNTTNILSIFTLLCLIISLSLVSSTTIINETYSDKTLIKEYKNTLQLDINIINATQGDYNVYTLSDVYLEPSNIFNLREGANYSSSYTITPFDRLLTKNGPYTINYVVNNRNIKKHQKTITVDIISIKDAIKIETTPININANQVTIKFTNDNNIELKDINMTFSSLLFQTTRTISLNAYDEEEITINIDTESLKKAKAGAYILTTQFNTPSGAIPTTTNIYVNEESGVSTLEDSKGIFLRTTTISKVNTGNTIENVRVEIKRNLLTRFFTSFSQAPISTVRKGVVVTYVWEETLGPSEILDIEASTNYFYPILIIISLIIVLFGINRAFTNKLIVKKSVTPIKTKNGEFALRIRILLKAKKYLGDVALVDKVPKTVKIYKKFGMTTPDHINPETRQLKWNVGEMKPGEERQFTYVVYSRVGYVGKFVLPKAHVRFKLDDETNQVESNNVLFLAEQSATYEKEE